MTKTRSETQTKPTAAQLTQDTMNRFAEFELAWLKPMGNFGIAMADAWADLIAESAAFVAARLKQDARTQHAMLHCRTPRELQEIQSAFVQKAIEDYQDETGRMTTLMESTARTMARGGNQAA